MKKQMLALILIFALMLQFFSVQASASQILVSNDEIGVSAVLVEEQSGSVDINSNNGTSDYRKWAQGDSRWGSIKLGSSSYTMSSSGCLVTAITKLIVQAGLKDSGSFNPRTMVNWLNSNSGFDGSGNLYWAKPATYSGLTNYGNLVSYGSYSSSGNNGQIITWINQGYHIVLNVNNGGHWIAVDEAKTLATGKVYIMDSLLNSANADVALADRYSTFNLAHAYKGGKTPPAEHECDKGTYKWNSDAHPHYKCYQCSVCGKINEFTDETEPLNTCAQCRPGKPILEVSVNDDGVATFTWDDTANTTHYNVWLAKKNVDNNWEVVERVFYAESGFQRTFGSGEYCAQLLSYSSKMWEPDGSDWVHTWADDIYFSIEDECPHNYTSTRTDATCVDYSYTTYTCVLCGDTYTVYDGDYTEWSDTQPEGVAEHLIETKTQYRYADKETTTSYDTSMSGWTQVGGEWKQSGSGSIPYVKSWPSGFLTSHSLYGTYNKTPKSASETNTDKTTINSDKTTGYLYYHWCRGTYANGPIDRTSKNVKDSTHNTFHAFYSTTSPSSLKAAPDNDGSYRYENSSCCKDTYWYYYTPVNTQTYTTYRKLFTYERWGNWSDWSDSVYSASDSRRVETRTMYRAIIGELGDHSWDDGVVTVEPTEESEGELRYTCTVCGTYKTETLPVLEHTHKYASSVTAPTCTEDGYTTYTCACGDSFVHNYVSALGHDYVDGVCTRCGEIDPSYGQPAQNPFTDVPSGSWFEKPVLWALENGITSGTSDTTFSPNNQCLRSQVVTFLWSAEGKPEPTAYTKTFTDVPAKAWYYKPVHWAVEQGITSGVSANEFGANNVCTRYQVVFFLWKAAGSPEPTAANNPFTDVKPSHFFYKAVLWAVENGITSGTSATTFSPTASCNRAQVVTFLYAAYN